MMMVKPSPDYLLSFVALPEERIHFFPMIVIKKACLTPSHNVNIQRVGLLSNESLTAFSLSACAVVWKGPKLKFNTLASQCSCLEGS